MPIDREKIRELLNAHPGSDNASLHELFQAIHEEKRRKNHQRAKSAQPPFRAQLHPGDMNALRAECLKPLTLAETSQDGLDYLTQTVADCLASNDMEDTLYALVRVWRKAWGMQPHLGPIEGVPIEGKTQ